MIAKNWSMSPLLILYTFFHAFDWMYSSIFLYSSSMNSSGTNSSFRNGMTSFGSLVAGEFGREWNEKRASCCMLFGINIGVYSWAVDPWTSCKQGWNGVYAAPWLNFRTVSSSGSAAKIRDRCTFEDEESVGTAGGERGVVIVADAVSDAWCVGRGRDRRCSRGFMNVDLAFRQTRFMVFVQRTLQWSRRQMSRGAAFTVCSFCAFAFSGSSLYYEIHFQSNTSQFFHNGPTKQFFDMTHLSCWTT